MFMQDDIRNNSKIISQVIFRKIYDQSIQKRSFSLNRNENDKETTATATRHELQFGTIFLFSYCCGFAYFYLDVSSLVCNSF